MTNTHVCAIGVMAKAPRAGRSKTRLCPPLTHEQAAALSAAFLRDVTENIVTAAQLAPIQGMIAHTPAGSEGLFDGHLATGTGFVLADGTIEAQAGIVGFGRCLLHAIQGMFDAGYAAACVLNSDSPTLPTAYLARAAAWLLSGSDRAVLGAAEDGGYYLLGMTAPHPRLFANIAWSTDTVAEATRARIAALGLETLELPPWYDVDDAAALDRLAGELANPGNGFAAPATASALRRIAAPPPSCSGLTQPSPATDPASIPRGRHWPEWVGSSPTMTST